MAEAAESWIAVPAVGHRYAPEGAACGYLSPAVPGSSGRTSSTGCSPTATRSRSSTTCPSGDRANLATRPRSPVRAARDRHPRPRADRPRRRVAARGRSATSPRRSACAGASPTRCTTPGSTSRAPSTCSRRRAGRHPQGGLRLLGRRLRPADGAPGARRRGRRPALAVRRLQAQRRDLPRHLQRALRHRVHHAGAVRTSTARASRPRARPGVVAIFTDALLSGTPTVVYGDGTQTRDYSTSTTSSTPSSAPAGKGDGRRFNLGTGVQTTDRELHSWSPPRPGPRTSRASRRRGWATCPRWPSTRRPRTKGSAGEPRAELSTGSRPPVEWARNRPRYRRRRLITLGRDAALRGRPRSLTRRVDVE